MIALVDCNNFFASCERLFRPDLKDKPVLVLSNNDGCVVARSNEVKALGVPMAVPYFKIRDIVEKNNVQCFSSNFSLYSNLSQRILGVLTKYAPQIEVYSIDEAFMELSYLPKQNLKIWGEKLRLTIARDIGMPVSVGIAPTKTLAKLAEGYAKKHKETSVIDPRKRKKAYEQVLSDTEIGEIWGIGWRLAPKLHAVGIRNALQLAQVSEAWIHSQMGISGTKLLQELRGVRMYPFEEVVADQKTLMASRSFGHTVKNPHELETALATFASQAAYKLRAHNQAAGYFGIYLRYKNREGTVQGQSMAVPLSSPSNDTSQLVHVALSLMERLYDTDHGYKKAGVFAHHLTDAGVSQLNLFDEHSEDEKERQKSFMQAIDEINHRFGINTIHVASIDPKTTQWRALKKRMSPAYVTDWSQLPLLHQMK